MMMIRRLQLAHTLVCALRILQQPCRGFSGDNSMLTVGTHVGVFPRIGNGHAVASLIMIRIELAGGTRVNVLPSHLQQPGRCSSDDKS